MSYHSTGVKRSYFGQNRHHENTHPNYPWIPPCQNRPMYPNKQPNNSTAQLNRYQLSFNNSDQYWCETCDRGFKTLQQLMGHNQQHQKCNIDGCQFVAHPKVITKHIQMQHSSGLYKIIAKLDNPEEIKKWIDERKKKYPTKQNIEKKSAEIKEKIERGEKMGLRQDRFQRSNSQGGAIKRKNTYNNGNFNNHQVKRHGRHNNVEKSKTHLKSNIKSKKVVQPKKVNILPPIDETKKLRPFTGIQNIDMDIDSDEKIEQIECNFDIEDDEKFNESEEGKATSEPIVCDALTSLMCNYGSSDEENEVVKEVLSTSNQNAVNFIENKSKETKFEIKNDKPKVTEENKSDEDSGPEEVKINTFDIELVSSESAKSNNVAKKQTIRKNDYTTQLEKRMFIRPKPKIPSTLLHKLLQKEVQHERNVILQCIRHIVKKNYFDK